MSLLDLNPQTFLAKWGTKIAVGAVVLMLTFGAGLYTMNRWNSGTIEKLKGEKNALVIKAGVDDGTITGLRRGINVRDAQIKRDGQVYQDKVKALNEAVALANSNAARANAAAQKLLTNKPRPGQDVIMSGVDQILETIP